MIQFEIIKLYFHLVKRGLAKTNLCVELIISKCGLGESFDEVCES